MSGFKIDSNLTYDNTVLLLADTTSIKADISTIDTNVDTINTKLGLSTDEYPTISIYSFLDTLLDHVHKPAMVYPYNADSVQVAGGVGAWAHGNKVEIIPANTIILPFDIHFIIVSQTSATDEYQLQLYAGGVGAEVLIAASKFYRDNTTRSTQYQIQTPIQAANTRISASLASASGGDNTRVSLCYHTY